MNVLNVQSTINMESRTFLIVRWTVNFDPNRDSGPINKASSQFCFLGNMWQIFIQSIQPTEGHHFVINAFVKMVNCYQDVKASVHIAALGQNDREICFWEYRAHTFTSRHQQPPFDDKICLSEFLKVPELFMDGVLKLRCQLIPAPEFILPDNCLEKQPNVPPFLTEVMKKYTDVILVVGKQQFKTHKVMLAAHSPVFDAMLSPPENPNQRPNQIKINDFDCEVVQEMLSYIYTGSSPKMEQLADRLLKAAEKFGIGGLKILCEQALCRSLSVDNAVKYQALATLYNANHLKQIVKHYIQRNIVEVQETNEWDAMVDVHSLSLGDGRDSDEEEEDGGEL